MNRWRITKYNPELRNGRGEYLSPEWTSFSDIGKAFRGVELSLEEYTACENAYINAVLWFFDENNEWSLVINDLETHKSNDTRISLHGKDMISSIANGSKVFRADIPMIVRAILREVAWCKLEGAAMYVHFGYDYYMYIGSKRDLTSKELCRLEKEGLFVEEFISPYSG